MNKITKKTPDYEKIKVNASIQKTIRLVGGNKRLNLIRREVIHQLYLECLKIGKGVTQND